MKKIITLSIFTFYMISAFTQEELKDYSDRQQAVFTNFITSYISLYHSSIDIGYEKRFIKHPFYLDSPHFVLEARAGIIIPFDGWVNDDQPESKRSNQKGWMTSITPKWIIPKQVNTYMIGATLNYTDLQYDATRYRDATLSETVTYQVISKVIGGNLIAGLREDMHIHKAFMEVSTGIGFKYHIIENNSSIPVQELETQSPMIGYLQPEGNGNHLRLAIPLNLKFGIRF